jgi:hypothetical protein
MHRRVAALVLLGGVASLTACSGTADQQTTASGKTAATDDLGFPIITRTQIARVKRRATETSTFRVLGGRGDRSTRSDSTYDRLPAFDQCFSYSVHGSSATWEFCFAARRLVFKRRVP